MLASSPNVTELRFRDYMVLYFSLVYQVSLEQTNNDNKELRQGPVNNDARRVWHWYPSGRPRWLISDLDKYTTNSLVHWTRKTLTKIPVVLY